MTATMIIDDIAADITSKANVVYVAKVVYGNGIDGKSRRPRLLPVSPVDAADLLKLFWADHAEDQMEVLVIAPPKDAKVGLRGDGEHALYTDKRDASGLHLEHYVLTPSNNGKVVMAQKQYGAEVSGKPVSITVERRYTVTSADPLVA